MSLVMALHTVAVTLAVAGLLVVLSAPFWGPNFMLVTLVGLLVGVIALPISWTATGIDRY